MFDKQNWQPVFIACGVTVLCLSLFASASSSLSYLDNKAFDFLASLLPIHSDSGRVAIVDIDDSSLAKVGRWPWPRDVLAKLVSRLHGAGPAVIALDMLFPEAGAAGKDDDLAAALGSARSVIGYDFIFESGHRDAIPCEAEPKPLFGPDDFPPSLIALPEAASVICDIKPLSAAAKRAGFINMARDADGDVRRASLLTEFRNAVYPSFALAAVLAQQQPNSGILVRSSAMGPDLEAGRTSVRLTDGANILLRYRGASHTLEFHSAAAMVDGTLNAADFAGKIVVIGSSAEGLEQTIRTPVDAEFPNVEVQATAIDNLLAGDFFLHPAWAVVLQVVCVFPVALAATLLLFRFSPAAGVLSALVLIAGIWAACTAVLFAASVFISPVLATLACGGALIVHAGRAIVIQEREGRRSAQELAMSNQFITGALGAMTAVRDVETGQHVVRIQGYLRSLCQVMQSRPRFAPYLTKPMTDLLVQLAPIHDIGKVGVPDHILRKPGPLTAIEFEQMKAHVALGKKILQVAREQSGLRDEIFFQTAVDIVYSHHERWDGTGYPLGLAGDEIPLPGRLLAVADVYDALISKRHYKTEILHAEAVEEIRHASGTHFDPEIVEGFLRVHDDWRRMAEMHRDEPGMAASQ